MLGSFFLSFSSSPHRAESGDDDSDSDTSSIASSEGAYLGSSGEEEDAAAARAAALPNPHDRTAAALGAAAGAHAGGPDAAADTGGEGIPQLQGQTPRGTFCGVKCVTTRSGVKWVAQYWESKTKSNTCAAQSSSSFAGTCRQLPAQ